MEFPGSAFTNFHILDGFSTIYYRVYVIDDGGPGSCSSDHARLPSGKSGRLRAAESILRRSSTLAALDTWKQELWIFSKDAAFPHLQNLGPTIEEFDDSSLRLDKCLLRITASGNARAAQMVTGTPLPSRGAAILASAKHGSGNTSDPTSQTDQAHIYRLLVTSLVAAVTWLMIQSQRFLQLNSRTFLGQDPSYLDDEASEIGWNLSPVLFTLEVALLPVGKVIVSMKSMVQPSLLRLADYLLTEQRLLTDMVGSSVWLAPSGCIARLIAQNEGYMPLASPASEAEDKQEPQAEHLSMRGAKLPVWKTDVVEWLEDLGIILAEDYDWVELEIMNPPFVPQSRFATDPKNPNVTQRLFWPSLLCFCRKPQKWLGRTSDLSLDDSEEADPVTFSETWFMSTDFRKSQIEKRKATRLAEEAQQQQTKAWDAQFRNPELPENLEILSRTTNYVDLQTASMVYPTPPDGTLSQAAAGTSSIDGLVATPFEAAETITRLESHSNPEDLHMGAPNPKTSIAPEQANAANAAIGNGLYDADGDEEMFGTVSAEALDGEGTMDEPNWDFFDDRGSDEAESRSEMEIVLAPRESHDAEQLERTGDGALRANTEDLSKLQVGDLTAVETIKTAEDVEFAPASDIGLKHNRDMVVESPAAEAAEAAESKSPEKDLQKKSPHLSPLDLKSRLVPQSIIPEAFDTANPHDYDQALVPRKESRYDAISFAQTVGSYDRKYSANGRFWFDTGDAVVRQGATPVDQDSLSIWKSRKEFDSKDGRLSGTNAHTPFFRADSDDESSDASSRVETNTFHGVRAKRKRGAFQDENTEKSSSPDVASLSIAELESLQSDHADLLERLNPDPTDWSLGGYFSALETRRYALLPLTKDETVKVAQMLVDQVTQSSLQSRVCDAAGSLSASTNVQPANISKALEVAFGSCITPTLDQLIRMLSKSASSNPDDGNSREGVVVKLKPAHVQLRRGKNPLEILPAAVSFWETFGLEPTHGSKDVISFCVVPPASSVVEGATAFLGRIGDVYRSCNLGACKSGLSQDSKGSVFDPLVTWDANDNPAVERLLSACEKLGQDLSRIPASSQNIVVYIVNPFDHNSALVDICTAFLRLFERYLESAGNPEGSKRNEVVLQVVPLSFIASEDSLVVPMQAEYLHLALEVYNRCPPKITSFELASPASAVVLADPIPKNINFSVHAEVPPSLLQDGLQDGKCLHIAYSQSLDQRWITAAWTDNTGSLQMNMSYCLREKGSSIFRTTAEVVREIWDTTCDIMRRARTRWRLMLVKDAPFDTMEAREWAMAASQATQNKPLPFSIVLISVDLAPALSLRTEPFQLYAGNANTQMPTYSTPVSTPQPNTLSPDQSGNAATPGSATMAANAPTPTEHSFEPDVDAVLLDPSDDTWGIVLSHRLNNSNSLLDYRPALASGYLMTRKGSTDADGTIVLGVNLVHAQAGTEFELLMEEILGYYRGLTILTKAKGMIHPLREVLPWHIATAVKGQQTLSQVL